MSGNATTSAWREAEDELEQDDAARLLGVPLETLLRWAHELSFPTDVGAEGAPRFRRVELETLRVALTDAHSVEGAIQEARRRLEG